MSKIAEFDAVIIGGGPAGSAAAAVLGERGRRVAVLEKSKFPRYHVGESLIPYCYYPLQRIGMIEKLKASAFTKKYSAQFVSSNGTASQPFYFFKHMRNEAANTWQVWRDEFDRMLLDNAREKGATVYEETLVRDVIEENGAVVGVAAGGPDGVRREFRAPMTIDASGRDSLVLSRTGWKIRDPHLNKIAIWTYYQGAMLDSGIDAGATTVAYLPEKGWFWYIPLAGGTVGVGVVAEKDYLYRDGERDLARIFAREIHNNAWIERHLAPGRQTGEYRITAEFSYRARHCASDGLILTGDAFAFLDPVFSSGVFLALRSGEMAGDAVDAALASGDVSARRFSAYGEELCKGIEAMRRLVYAFYDREFNFREFLSKYPNLRNDLTDTIVGNLQKDFDALYAGMAEFARLPEPLTHGAPHLDGSLARAHA